MNPAADALGLYIHLPWCEKKCPYCDFNSHERQNLPEDRYISALLRDLDHDVTLAGSRQITSIFIGGGTPSLFSAGAIDRLLQGVNERLSLAGNIEITLESNPGSAEAGKFAGFRAAGVNRLSLGIQSFHDASLRALGRVHSAAQALRAVEAARTAGFDNLNLDLMHGLPEQSVNEGLADLQQALQLAPEHLSWYQLTIEPNTRFYSAPPLLPVEDSLARLEEEGGAMLAAGGFMRYEVSAYARGNARCRHNLTYWQFGDYLALGAGAHGKITRPDGSVWRYAKARQPDAYLDARTGQHTSQQRHLSAQDLAGEFMLNALRLDAGVPVQRFSEATGLPFAAIEATVASLVGEGLLEENPDRLRTTALGGRFLDSVVARFFPD
ncbi:MAG: radical SAM family heme chaperone HemW [Chromatocurvus sp.]